MAMVTDSETILVPEGPPIPGLRFRHFRGIDADVPLMHAVAKDVRTADGEVEPLSLAGMRAWYDHLERCDPATDIAIIELDRRVVGYGRVKWADTNDNQRYYDMTCYLHPDFRRRGIGRALLAWAERRSQDIAAGHAAVGNGLDRPWWFTAFRFDGDRGADALLRQCGYQAFRRFHSMVRPDLDDIPDRQLPLGIEIRPIPEDREAMRRVFLADGEAFRDHFGWVDDSDEAFLAFVEDPATDPRLWLVAFDGDEIAAGVLNGIHTLEDGTRQGWLDSVFTRRPWRQRGLARALIARSLVLLREQGLDAAYLGVDSENPNQALGLYESAGFQVASSSTAYRKPLLVAG
jgi:mycothiol synthase